MAFPFRDFASRLIQAGCTALTLFGILSSSALAQAAFTAEQKKAIAEITRETLLKNPAIVGQALMNLKKDAETAEDQRTIRAVRENWKAFETAPSYMYEMRGNPKGSLHVTEFVDPRCAYCRRMEKPVAQWLKNHPEIRLTERLIPVLGPSSVLGTRAILAAAQQGKYRQMRELVLDAPSLSEARITEFARSLGLDLTAFNQDLGSPKVAREITQNLQLAQKINLEGTPTFVFGKELAAFGGLSPGELESYAKQAEAMQKGGKNG